MCIIAAKPAGVAMPAAETIENMWYNNPDGAGLMWADGQRVHIDKGFMSLDALQAHLVELAHKRDLTATPTVLHFRIATHGGVRAENTHPFPLSESVGALKKLSCTAPVGVAHNGIISSVTPEQGISDTMQYIADVLAPLAKALPTWYRDKHALRLVRNTAASRLCILPADGHIVTIGDGWATSNGVLYSNGSYKPYKWAGWTACTPWAEKRLMWLPRGAYVRTDDGDIDDGDLYLLDSDGELWYYDFETDAAAPVTGTAYTSAGVLCRYNDAGDVETLPVM